MNISCLIPVMLLLAFPPVEWLVPKEYDFGIVSIGNEQIHNFLFKNSTSKAVHIDNVRTTCGCTVLEWQQTPIFPDSIANITVRFDATRLGKFKKRIKVFVSNQRKAEILEISGEVVR
ncbi:MAG: DUF1573 domain-containing protein [Bacteroidota bacterium]